MPTVAVRPSLKDTQAVGAVLLHQFARQRFSEAGIDYELIQEAENMDEVNQLTNELLQNEDDSMNDTKEVSSFINQSDTELNGTSLLHSSQTDNSEVGDQYHSISESLSNNENTVYHSINGGSRVGSNLDKMQSLPDMAFYGRELRKIAEEFAKSPQRQSVKERANNVQLDDINKETFLLLLEELFQGGITREKIVLLFFFCTDVALRAVVYAQELVVKLLGWSFSYIINRVCKLVYELGGWNGILARQLPDLLINCFAVLGVCALALYLFNHKSLRA